MQDKLNKLAKVAPAQRPQTTGVTHRQLRIQTDSKARPTPITGRTFTKEVPTYSTTLHVSPEAKRLAAQHKPQPKPHAETFVLRTVIKDAVVQEWTPEQRKAWKKHNKSNPNHQIHL